MIFNCLWTKCSLICQNYCSLWRENILCKLCRELSEERVWNWVKSAKDNIGQGPQIIGSWSLELKIPRYLVWNPKESLWDSLWNWVKSATDTIGQRILQDPHWKLSSSYYSVRFPIGKFSHIEQLQYIHCVHFAQKGFVLTNLNPWINFARFFSRLTTVFLFCELCEQEKQETLPLGLSTALPARGKFVEKQLTHI